MYALIENNAVQQYPYDPNALKAAYSTTSFPATMSDASLESYNVYRAYFSTPPVYAERTQVLVEGTPVFDAVASRWTQVWSVRDKSADEMQAETDAQAAAVRATRNQELAACDWTQLSDAPVDHVVWAAYRQQLRDISSQPGFPWEIIWPVAPQ